MNPRDRGRSSGSGRNQLGRKNPGHPNSISSESLSPMIAGSNSHRTMVWDLMTALPRLTPLTVTRTICPITIGICRLSSTSNSSTNGRPNEGMVRARLLRNPTAQTIEGSWPLQPSWRNWLLFPQARKSICNKYPPRSSGLLGDIPKSGICRAVLMTKFIGKAPGCAVKNSVSVSVARQRAVRTHETKSRSRFATSLPIRNSHGSPNSARYTSGISKLSV